MRARAAKSVSGKIDSKERKFERARAKKPFLPLLRWCAAPDENVGAKVGAVRPYHCTVLSANLGK